MNNYLNISKFLSTYILILTYFFGFSVKTFATETLEGKKICTQDLPSVIKAIIDKPQRKGETWGILIKNLDNGEILYEQNSDKYLIPASNIKLLTTIGILINKGENFTIKTPIYINKNFEENKVNSLIIEGKSDPTLTTQNLEVIINKLKEKKINEIDKLILVDHKLPNPIINYTWEFSDIFYSYAVPVSSFILDQNTVILTIKPSTIGSKISFNWSNELAGKQWLVENLAVTTPAQSNYNFNVNPNGLNTKLTITGNLPLDLKEDNWFLSIPNPSKYFKDSLLNMLLANKIKVNSVEIKEDNVNFNNNPDYQLLLEITSPNLKELIKVVNQDSNNLYAEILLNKLKEDNLNNEESLKNTLKDFGLTYDYKIKDGSGLSRQNLVTTEIIVNLLELINNSKYQDTFKDSLSVAGINGTLKNRFQDSIIKNKLYGKTGTLTGVSALSGYLEVSSYDNLVFSIIVNNSLAKNTALRSEIDQVVLILGSLENCVSF